MLLRDPVLKLNTKPCRKHYGSHQTARKVLDSEFYWPTIFKDAHLIVTTFGVPKALISDQGSHFCNKTMSTLLKKYGVAEVFNKVIKQILQKVAHPNRKDWSWLLKDALWAHRTTYQTLLGMSPYQIVFGKAYHLPIEIEHYVYWAMKRCNFSFDQAGKERKIQLQELEELHLKAYENSKIYKEKVKRFHDSMILRKEFKVGQKVLLFNFVLS
ncbi:Retrovirus-related Pol polyprotein, partial [Mucuna pruriens]